MLFGVVTLVAAAILGLSAVLFKALDKSESFTLWAVPVALVLTVVGVVSGAMGKASDWREKRAHAAREWRAEATSLLRLPIRSGRLPRLAELGDVELGVTPTRYTASVEDEYVGRPTADALLRKVLACTESPFPFVVLHGDSKAGKSRTMIEAARHVWPHAPTVVPVDGQALAELTRLEPPLPLETSPAVVWLDDVSAADLDALTVTVLDAWSSRALIAATMTTMGYRNVMRTGSEVGATARDALRRAVVQELPFDLSKDERAEGQRLYPHEQLSADDNDRPVSIGEVLVAGEELVGRLHAGLQDCPAGQAIARAAIDVRRAGLKRPISETGLQHLFPLYLRQVNAGIPPTTEQFRLGLAWAAAPVASQVAILRHVAASRWAILDYVVEAESGKRNHTLRPIPNFLWAELLANTTPTDALAISAAAYLHGLIGIATDAARKAQQYSRIAPRATLFLGILLVSQGDTAGAHMAFQQAIDSGHPEVAARAFASLGNLLAGQGDTAGAHMAFQQAIDSGYPKVAASAFLGLGYLLAKQGDTAEAHAAFQRVIESDNRGLRLAAIYLRGCLLAKQGDLDGAATALRQAIDSRHREVAPRALVSLGNLLAGQGDAAGAHLAFQEAIDSHHPAAALEADVQLGILLAQDGNTIGAGTIFRQAIGSGYPNAAANAALNLGVLLMGQGDVDGAAVAWQQAIDSGHLEVAPRAAVNLGILLAEHGDVAGARVALQRAVDSGHPEVAPRAEQAMKDLLDN